MTKLSPPRVLGLLFLFLLTAQITTAQDVIHCRNFNSQVNEDSDRFPSPLDPLNNRSVGDGEISHNFDLNQTRSTTGSDLNTCENTTAGQSLTFRGGAGLGQNGRSLDFDFSSEGYENLILSFWSRRTGSGFNDNQIQYSIDDGVSFTNLPSLDYTPDSGSIVTLDISNAAPLANNQSNLIIRIIFDGASNANGNNRIDNVKLEGEFLNDQTSEVVVPLTQVGASTVVAADIGILPVFSFDIEDLGSGDGLSTTVTQMRFVAGANNTVDWSTFTNVAIQDASFTEIPGTAVVTASEVIFTPTTPVDVADGASDNFTVEVTLDQANIIDGSVIQFQVDGTDSGFEAEFSGSVFSSPLTAGDVVGSNITLDVVATEIAFLQQPSDVDVLATMSPNVEVGFIDINANLDTSNTSAVGLTSSGDLDSTPLSATAVAGIATFSSIIHNTPAQGLILTASTPSFTDVESTPFDVLAANDETSEVVIPSTSQVGASTVVAADTSILPVFSFDIEDLGSGDGLSTTVTQMRFVAGANNTADWSTFTNVTLQDASPAEIPGTALVTANEVIFTPDNPVAVADGVSDNFTVEVTLDQANIIDGSVIQFQVAGTNSGFEAEFSGSIFNSSFTAGEVVGNDITLDVVATELTFIQNASDVRVNLPMSPAVELGFFDVNGNLDITTSSVVELTSTGDLDTSPLTLSPTNGIVTFSNIIHNTQGVDLALTASTTDPFSATSTLFNVFNNDITSEVRAPLTQIPAGTVIAANATGTPEPVFSFDIIDQGDGDNEPTTVTQMRFEAGGNNTANWPLTFQDVVVREASSVVAGTAVINDNEIIFTPDASVVVADGASVNFTVEVILNETNITDESILEFQVPETGLGFIAEISGSIFNSTFTGGTVTGNLITINVVASEIAFLQQPSDVEVNAFITPAVQVAYVDENGNVDTSIITDISLTSSGGTLVNPLNPVSAVNGVATFPNIAYSAEVTGLTLTADTTEPLITPNSITSNPFNVGIPVIAIQDFDGTQPEWVYSTSITAFDDGWETAFFGVIDSGSASPLASGSFLNTIFGENDLNSPSGTSGFASLDFVTVDISGYTNVDLTFDWEVNGYESATDRIEYQVTFDGVSQTRVTLFEGFTSTQDGSGTETIPVPLGTNEVSFQYFIQNDGVDGFSGLDNVKLTGDSNARDTDIIAGDPQIEGEILIADVNDEFDERVEVFSFEVIDSGNFDALPTNVTRLRFVPGGGNTADWATMLQGISISDGTNTLDQANQTVTITSDEILVDITAGSPNIFEVPDGTSKNYIVSVFLNTSGIIDQEVIQLAIAEGNQDQLASSDGSIFSQDITTFEGSTFNIQVIGTQLEFFVQPTTTFVDVSMSPSVRVRNLDANDNVDLDNTVSILISSEGTLNGGSVSRNISSSLGYASFNTLQHTATGFDLRLTASTTSGSTSIESLEFNIILESTLLISEVIDPSDDENGRYVELFNMDVEPIDLDDQNYFLINPSGTGESIQLTGQIIPPKSYFIISFTDDATFNLIHGRDADFVAPSTLGSDGTDIYQLSFDVNEPRAVLDVYGDAGTGWEFTGQRAYRNIPTVRVSNSTYTSSEWTLESTTSSDATIGVGDNDYVYSNDTDIWGSVGIGTPPGGSISESIFVENGTATLSASTIISDVVVRDGATLIIEDAITLDGDFANFGKVTFKSNSTKTAVLGPFPAKTRQLVGDNFEIERFIPKSNRAFRYLSSPVNTSLSPKPTIRDNWQEGQNNTETGDTNNQNDNLGFGTHITGSTAGANGFDATLTGNPSMFEWDASSAQWNSIPNTSGKTFNAGEAYAILIRGDRSTTLNSNSAVGPATTLRTTGKLSVGSKSAPNLSSTVGGFSLIGNPYQAKVNLTTLLSVNSNGVSSQFVYIYDPTLGSIGGYATVDLSDGSSIPETSSADNFLEPNQAFFVETVPASESPVVIFNESFKTTVTDNNTTFSEPEELTNMNINLNEDILTSGNTVIDAVRVKFRNGGNNAKDTLDATKVWNYEESFAIDRNPSYMSIETRAMPTVQDSVPLYFGNSKLLAYRLVVEPENLVNTKAYLYDRYLESSTELPTDIATSVSFKLDPSIPESKATDRFVIKFEEVSLGTEDVVFNSSMEVYPNPVRGNSFSISHQQAFDGQVLSLQLFDLQGRMVLDQELTNSSRMTVNLNNSLSSGVYILKLSDAKNSQTTKLIIE